jgi:hypothetical protein
MSPEIQYKVASKEFLLINFYLTEKFIILKNNYGIAVKRLITHLY